MTNEVNELVWVLEARIGIIQESGDGGEKMQV